MLLLATAMDFSVIIPTYNEANQICRAIESARKASFDDIVVVDGGSSDETVSLAKATGAEVLECSLGRSVQMNLGGEAAKGDVLLFLHADTTLPIDARQLLERVFEDGRILGGAFHLRFDSGGWLMRLVSFQANIRSYCTVPWGDQALFVRSDFFVGSGGYRQWGLMEDVEMAHRIKRGGRFAMIKTPVVTSGRRFRQNGFAKSALRNMLLMLAFYLRINPNRLARFYSYKPRNVKGL